MPSALAARGDAMRGGTGHVDLDPPRAGSGCAPASGGAGWRRHSRPGPRARRSRRARATRSTGAVSPAPSQPANSTHRIADAGAARREQVLQEPPEHPLHELTRRDLADRHGRLAPAVAEDRHAIGELEDLAEAVGDVDDRASLGDERRTTSLTRAISVSDRAAVGSSRMRMRASRATQTSDLHELLFGDRRGRRPGPTDRRRRGRPGPGTAAPERRAAGRLDQAPVGMPEEHVLGRRERRDEASSCWTTAIPARRRALAMADRRSAPSRTISPLSGRTSPARILTSVLLPAPFSPTSAMTSPACELEIDVRRAPGSTPYAFDIPSMRSRRSGSTGTGPGPVRWRRKALAWAAGRGRQSSTPRIRWTVARAVSRIAQGDRISGLRSPCRAPGSGLPQRLVVSSSVFSTGGSG